MTTPAHNKKHLLIYGTLAIDTLIAPAGTADSILGGSATFAALAARLITDKAKLIGVVGTDFPPSYSELLESRGVSMEHVDCLEGRSFAWTGRYEDDINIRETVETVIGVQEHWQLELAEELKDPAVAVVCNSSPELQLRFIEQCRDAYFIMLDSMKLWLTISPELIAELLPRVDLVLMNEEEAQYFSSSTDIMAAGHAILEAGPCYAIVKLGSKGAVFFYRDEMDETQHFHSPAWKLENAVDPTGAGDCYLGALAAYYGEHFMTGYSPSDEQWKCALEYAAVVAARVCEDMGPNALITFSTEEMHERVKRFH